MEQQRDTVFTKPGRPGDFEFNDEVAAVFDDMLQRSIPFYSEQQEMAAALARDLWQPGTAAFDLGCSNGNMLLRLAGALPACPLVVGIDNSVPMLEEAAARVRAAGLEGRVRLLLADLNGDLDALGLEHAGLVTACWTLQFVDPARRDALARRVFEALVEGGGAIVCEKVLAGDRALDGRFTEAYYGFKRRQGYSDSEIWRKREALENVLVPYRLEDDLALFRRAGFRTVEPFFQWFNFAAFVCIK
jgi:tRNA (cmo5U34)-methyltransferase